jgi:hypothetical protein
MSNRNVIDLAVVQLRITMREDVAKPDDVPGMGDLLSYCWCNSVKLVQGLAADFQHPLNSGSGFVVCQILFETESGSEADCQAGLMLNVFEVDARITLRHRRATCFSRCNTGAGCCESLAARGDRPSDRILLPVILSDPRNSRSCLQLAAQILRSEVYQLRRVAWPTE